MATDSPFRVIKCCHNQQMIAHYTGKGLSVVAVNGTTREVNATCRRSKCYRRSKCSRH